MRWGVLAAPHSNGNSQRSLLASVLQFSLLPSIHSATSFVLPYSERFPASHMAGPGPVGLRPVAIGTPEQFFSEFVSARKPVSGEAQAVPGGGRMAAAGTVAGANRLECSCRRCWTAWHPTSRTSRGSGRMLI